MANGRGERARIASGTLKKCDWFWGSHGCERKENHVPPCRCDCGMKGPTSDQLSEGVDFYRFKINKEK